MTLRGRAPGHEFGDEVLNAFVDGQLSGPEAAALASAIRDDRQLRSRVERLERLKTLVRQAYGRAPGTRSR